MPRLIPHFGRAGHICLGGPYGPVKDKMYWSELARRSEKCAGPVLMSRAATHHHDGLYDE